MSVCLLLNKCETVWKKGREYEQICKFGLFALSMEYIHLVQTRRNLKLKWCKNPSSKLIS
jgi:hypothetical protein